MNVNLTAVNPVHQQSPEAGQCPLCGGANGCQLCTAAADSSSCWCMTGSIPDELLARVPAELRNRACICAACVTDFHRQQLGARLLAAWPGDFYFEAGLMVFTAAYHRRRGYCCGSGCRHCPYPGSK